MVIHIRFFFFILLFFIVLTPIAGIPLENFIDALSESELKILYSGELLVHDDTYGESLKYMPKGTGIEKLALQKSSINTDGFSVESLSYIPFTEKYSEMNKTELLLDLVNKLRTISTQKGITYISHRKGDKPFILFKKSYHVENIESKRKIDDPVLSKLEKEIHDVIFQQDTSFGGNYYSYDILVSDTELQASIKNLTTLSVFGLFPAVKKGDLNMFLSLAIADEGVLCYCFTVIKDQAPEISILGYKVHLPSAFQRRMKAFQDWYSSIVK